MDIRTLFKYTGPMPELIFIKNELIFFRLISITSLNYIKLTRSNKDCHDEKEAIKSF